MIKNLKIIDFIAASLSSILLSLAFPTYNLWPLAWVALFPLFFAIHNKTPLQSFWIGWFQGIIFYLITLKWIINTMVNYGNLPLFISVPLLILLAMYLALYNALFCFSLSYLSRQKAHNPLYAAFIWVSLEYLRAHLLSGFPWASLAYSQFKFLSIIQIADITSIYGISFLIVLINALLYLFLDYFYCFQSEKTNYTLLKNNFIVAVLLFSITIGYGFWRNSYFMDTTGKKSLKVALIQGNIEQEHKWDTRFQKQVYNTYQKMTLNAAKKNPDLIVWPEAATPFYFPNNQVYKKNLLKLGKKSRSYILFGSPRYEVNQNDITLFNSAFLISPDNKTIGQYDKIHLVPFGEYVPFKKILFFVDKMVTGIGNFGTGIEYFVFSLQDWKFSVLICFEVIFPDLARHFVKNGAEFLINITNDAWFGKSAAPYQHISMVVFRAIENRRPVIRAANTGISGIVDKRGKIKDQTDIFIRAQIIGNIIPEKNYQTFYTHYGDVFAISVLLFTIVFIILKTYGQKFHRYLH